MLLVYLQKIANFNLITCLLCCSCITFSECLGWEIRGRKADRLSLDVHLFFINFSPYHFPYMSLLKNKSYF